MCLSACAPDPSRYVAQQQYDQLQAQLKDAQTKLNEAEKKLTEYEGHRYSLFNAAFRMFRTDSIYRPNLYRAREQG
jgi:outer membrane protein TolC